MEFLSTSPHEWARSAFAEAQLQLRAGCLLDCRGPETVLSRPRNDTKPFVSRGFFAFQLLLDDLLVDINGWPLIGQIDFRCHGAGHARSSDG